jgi:hypothetical protein
MSNPDFNAVRKIAEEARKRKKQKEEEQERQRQEQERQRQEQEQEQEQERQKKDRKKQDDIRMILAKKHQEYLDRPDIKKEREERERKEKEEQERLEREERERLEREEREERERFEREERERLEREERERFEREERERLEKEERDRQKKTRHRFLRDLNLRRIGAGMTVISALQLPGFYNIGEILNKYIEFGIVDENQISFYIGDVHNILRSLELLYESPLTLRNYDFISFLRNNHIYWDYRLFERKPINDDMMRAINNIFLENRGNIEVLRYLQYYLHTLNESLTGEINSSIIAGIAGHYIPQHIRIVENLSDAQKNSFEINSFVAEKIFSEMGDDEIFLLIIDKFLSQEGGYKKKFLKYQYKVQIFNK